MKNKILIGRVISHPLSMHIMPKKHDSTRFAPHYLIFGWHPRLAIDAYLGLDQVSDSAKSMESYVQKTKKRLQ